MTQHPVFPRWPDGDDWMRVDWRSRTKAFDDGLSKAIVESESRGEFGFSEDETERVRGLVVQPGAPGNAGERVS
jgi:hypothetical protein